MCTLSELKVGERARVMGFGASAGGYRRKLLSLGILPGVVGLLEATEAIKLVLGIGESLAGRLLQFDALAMRFREFRVEADPQCPVCAPDRAFNGYPDYMALCAGADR